MKGTQDVGSFSACVCQPDKHAAYYTWAVRGKQTVDRVSLSCAPTIQADLMLCDVCTAKCDAVEVPEDRNLTRAEVNKALGLPMETT